MIERNIKLMNGECLCLMCGTNYAENTRKLDMHHIIPDKEGGEWGDNLLLVCNSCHISMDIERRFIKKYLKLNMKTKTFTLYRKHTIYLTADQKEWLSEHEEFNISGWLRPTFDDFIIKYNSMPSRR